MNSVLRYSKMSLSPSQSVSKLCTWSLFLGPLIDHLVNFLLSYVFTRGPVNEFLHRWGSASPPPPIGGWMGWGQGGWRDEEGWLAGPTDQGWGLPGEGTPPDWAGWPAAVRVIAISCSGCSGVLVTWLIYIYRFYNKFLLWNSFKIWLLIFREIGKERDR